MSEHDIEEFRNAVRQIGYYSMKIENPYVYESTLRTLSEVSRNNKVLEDLNEIINRVRVCEWVRKLVSLSDDCIENTKKKNEYIQYLRIQVTQSMLQPPFTKPPPDAELPPLPELLGNLMCRKIPGLPKPGPLTPCMIHKSPDGRAYISIKHVPGDGILCYMAVTPEPMELE